MKTTRENFEPTRKHLAHEIPTRINKGPMKYQREQIWHQRNTNQKKLETHEIPTKKYFRPT